MIAEFLLTKTYVDNNNHCLTVKTEPQDYVIGLSQKRKAGYRNKGEARF